MMDNSDLRRGKPTTHKVHGADMALLASDALLMLAFACCPPLRCWRPLEPIGVCRQCRPWLGWQGPDGLVGGQAMDMITSSDEQVELGTIEYIHRNKTGALIQASVLLGGIFGCASDADMGRLNAFGENFGIAYQIVDDIADASETEEQTGKTAGQDLKNRKATYVSLLGLSGAKEKALQYLATARQAAASLDIGGEFRISLVDFWQRRLGVDPGARLVACGHPGDGCC